MNLPEFSCCFFIIICSTFWPKFRPNFAGSSSFHFFFLVGAPRPLLQDYAYGWPVFFVWVWPVRLTLHSPPPPIPLPLQAVHGCCNSLHGFGNPQHYKIPVHVTIRSIYHDVTWTTCACVCDRWFGVFVNNSADSCGAAQDQDQDFIFVIVCVNQVTLFEIGKNCRSYHDNAIFFDYFTYSTPKWPREKEQLNSKFLRNNSLSSWVTAVSDLRYRIRIRILSLAIKMKGAVQSSASDVTEWREWLA